MVGDAFMKIKPLVKISACSNQIDDNENICDPASQNQQKVAWPSFVLWLEIGDQG